ncbi:MAG: hypothetical protein IAE96_07195 [Chitinophagaceae bacterium]|nr:hypothetical protein [Chitinophagaceae bacterium]
MKKLFTVGLLLPCLLSPGQDSTEIKKQWELAGYVKELGWVRSDHQFGNARVTGLLHNRILVKWKPGSAFTGRIELRNRIYWGEDVRQAPDFSKLLDNPDEAIDLSASWWKSRSVTAHTAIDRLWLEYRRPGWNLRAGRQRINWGLLNTWNPNDLFNSYSFLDFDYEERPGADAVKWQYLPSDRSSLEWAVAATGSRPIVGAKYAINSDGYDLQINAGLYQHTFTAGFGWAGHIGEAGFKGELQYYAGRHSAYAQWLFSAEGDYMFENGYYLAAALLYNQKGADGPLLNPEQLNFQASPRSLMPAKWNLLTQAAKEFTPRFSGRLHLVYSPGPDLLILFPSLSYNLKTNWDLDFVWQSFFARTHGFGAISHNAYLRLKRSF